MGAGFGLAAVVLSVVSIFIPLIGAVITVLTAALAVASARSSPAMFVAAIAINFVNIVFLSPVIWASDGARQTLNASESTSWGTWLIGIQVIALVAGLALSFQSKSAGATRGDGSVAAKADSQ